MKKKILFIIGTLQSGGVSKSLCSLLNVFDTNKYDVHLLIVCTDNCLLLNQIPKNVTIHTNNDINDLHRGFIGIKNLLKRKMFILALGSILRIALSKVNRGISGWLLSRLMPTFTTDKFDTIIDYQGQQLLYYMVDKLKSTKKISFFHSDYSRWDYYYLTDKFYYPKIDNIITISEKCVLSLIKYFPNCKSKIRIVQNISSPQIIKELASIPISLKKVDTTLITIGHVQKLKGTDIAINAAKILKESKYNFIWYFVGKINDYTLIKKVKHLGLENNIIFLGIQTNPYPYIKASDIVVHPSRYEGKSIVLDEAKILCKPIVVTNFSTVTDQFEDKVNASICNMNEIDLSNKIIRLIDHPEIRNSYISNLSQNIGDNSSEIKKLYHIIED